MSPIVVLAHKFGGHIDGSSVLVPAAQIANFLRAAENQGVKVPYIECLFFSPPSVQPSMEYSRERDHFQTGAEFIAFAEHASEAAIHEAQAKGFDAFFEVDVITDGGGQPSGK